MPLFSSVAVCHCRAVFRPPVGVKVPVTGSYQRTTHTFAIMTIFNHQFTDPVNVVIPTNLVETATLNRLIRLKN
jgi:hypothetical protein